MGRPASREPGRTPFAKWLRGVVDDGRDVAEVASACEVSGKTVYDWLAGKGPYVPHLVREGVEARLGLARSLPASGVVQSDEPEVEPMVERAVAQVKRLYWRDHAGAEWQAIATLLERLVGDPNAAPGKPPTQKKGPTLATRTPLDTLAGERAPKTRRVD